MTSKFKPKIEKQLDKRGWTKDSVRDTIANPHQTKPTRDTRYLPDGSKMNDPATAYIMESFKVESFIFPLLKHLIF